MSIAKFAPPTGLRPDGHKGTVSERCAQGKHQGNMTVFKRMDGTEAWMRVCKLCGNREVREIQRCETCHQPTESTTGFRGFKDV
jgi:hypothetical protein